MIKNDTTQPIQFVLDGNRVYNCVIKYPKTHHFSFVNDLINFGEFVAKYKSDILKSKLVIINWWEDRQYEIQLI
jgi:hypothetical protein